MYYIVLFILLILFIFYFILTKNYHNLIFGTVRFASACWDQLQVHHGRPTFELLLCPFPSVDNRT